jgi:hypothetical protein
VRDQPKEKQFRNKNTDKIVKSKFERELKGAQQDLGLQSNNILNYEEMCGMLKATGFLPQAKEPEQVDQTLLQDLWRMVQGESNEGVSLDTLRVVLLNCIGVKEEGGQEEEDKEEGEQQAEENGDTAAEHPLKEDI